jgi:hypothetical protein
VDFDSAEGKHMLEIFKSSFKDIVHQEVKQGIREFIGSSRGALRGSNNTTVVGEFEPAPKDDKS